MAFTVYYDDDLKCIVGFFVGRLDLESSQEYIQEVLRVLAERNCNHFLSDLREAELALSTAQIYDLPETLDALGLHHCMRRAILVRRRTPDMDFYETTSINRGYQVRVFDRQESAVEWLHAEVKPRQKG